MPTLVSRNLNQPGKDLEGGCLTPPGTRCPAIISPPAGTSRAAMVATGGMILYELINPISKVDTKDAVT